MEPPDDLQISQEFSSGNLAKFQAASSDFELDCGHVEGKQRCFNRAFSENRGEKYSEKKEKSAKIEKEIERFGTRSRCVKPTTKHVRLMKSTVDSTTPETSFWPTQYTDFPRSGAPQQNRGEYKQLKAEDNEAAPRGSIEKNRGRAGGFVVKEGRRNKPSEAAGGSLYAQKRQCSEQGGESLEFSKSRSARKKRYGCRNVPLPRVPLFPSVLRQEKNLRLLFSTTT